MDPARGGGPGKGGSGRGRPGGPGKGAGGKSGGRPQSKGRAKSRTMGSSGSADRRGGQRPTPPRGRGANPRARHTSTAAGLGGDQVEGRQAVRELLRANRRPVRSLVVAEGMDDAAILDEIEALAATRRVRVERASRRRIESLARTEAPQGVVALARPVEETPLETLCEQKGKGRAPFLLVLDGITDPHNVGALLRSAECAGVTGVVLPRNRSVHLSPTVTKVAAGAIEYLPMALVPGIPAALPRLSALGVWTVGLVGERGSLSTICRSPISRWRWCSAPREPGWPS